MIEGQEKADAASSSLAGKSLFITGASRGIGLAIALRAARDGAHIAVAAKTDKPHPLLKGTVHTACQAIEEAGGQALACVMDVRDEAAVARAVEQTVERFGGIDILVNNASAISLSNTANTSLKSFDLMHSVNARGTFLCAKLCLPHLRRSTHAHILTLSPPLNLEGRWFEPHLAYTLSKYAMSLCTMGLAAELRAHHIAANSLWPRTIIATAAVEKLLGHEGMARARTAEIMADAAHCILTQPPDAHTGQFFIDEDVLRDRGVTDFSQYRAHPDAELELQPDLFV